MVRMLCDDQAQRGDAMNILTEMMDICSLHVGYWKIEIGWFVNLTG